MTDKERVFTVLKLSCVNMQMIRDFGKDSTFWTKALRTTDTYSQILNPKTKMYLEGTIYLCDCLITELGLHLTSIEVITDQEQLEYERRVSYLQYEVLLNLPLLCKISPKQADVIFSTDLIDFIKFNYELYHTQSIYTIIEDLAEYLKEEYDISISLANP